MLQKNPADYQSAGFFYYYFILFKHLFRLIQSLDYRVGIIQAQLSSLGEILDTSLLVATLGTCDTSIIIRLSQTVVYLQRNGIIIYRLGKLVSSGMQITSVIIDIGIAAVHADGIAEISLGRMDVQNTLALSLVKFIHLSLTDCTLPVSQRVLVIERDIIGEITDGSLKITKYTMSDGPAHQETFSGFIIARHTQLCREFIYHREYLQRTILIELLLTANDINLVCLGMQIAVIEYARNVAGIPDAHSGEFDELCKNKVIDFMPGQSNDIDKGGTLRLGAYPCVIQPDTTMARCYGTGTISERHRHRYEFNTNFRSEIENAGLEIVGTSPDGKLVEMVELRDHPWFVACQFHPEFKSTPLKAHPLFRGFVKAALAHRDNA